VGTVSEADTTAGHEVNATTSVPQYLWKREDGTDATMVCRSAKPDIFCGCEVTGRSKRRLKCTKDDRSMTETFNLHQEDFEAIDVAIKIAEKLLHHPRVSPAEIIHLRNAIQALEKLPVVTEGADIEFGVYDRFENEDFSETKYVAFHITEEEFRISRGGSTYDRESGSDTISLPGWHVDVYGERTTECEIYQLEGEVAEFLEFEAIPFVRSNHE
jgi:hypothetical protein